MVASKQTKSKGDPVIILIIELIDLKRAFEGNLVNYLAF